MNKNLCKYNNHLVNSNRIKRPTEYSNPRCLKKKIVGPKNAKAL